MLGALTCRAHGGASPQARLAARIRIAQDADERAFTAAYTKWRHETEVWQARRVRTVARLMNVAPEDVTDVLIGFCIAWHGAPEGPETAPRMRRDRRSGPRKQAAA
jgi:L-asparaginase II